MRPSKLRHLSSRPICFALPVLYLLSVPFNGVVSSFCSQTEKNHSIRLSMEQLRLPCMSQSLKIRDGDASSAEMLARLSGAPLQVPPIISTGPALLIEFNAGDIIITSGEECAGGFLAHISQIGWFFKKSYSTW